MGSMRIWRRRFGKTRRKKHTDDGDDTHSKIDRRNRRGRRRRARRKRRRRSSSNSSNNNSNNKLAKLSFSPGRGRGALASPPIDLDSRRGDREKLDPAPRVLEPPACSVPFLFSKFCQASWGRSLHHGCIHLEILASPWILLGVHLEEEEEEEEEEEKEEEGDDDDDRPLDLSWSAF